MSAESESRDGSGGEGKTGTWSSGLKEEGGAWGSPAGHDRVPTELLCVKHLGLKLVLGRSHLNRLNTAFHSLISHRQPWCMTDLFLFPPFNMKKWKSQEVRLHGGRSQLCN